MDGRKNRYAICLRDVRKSFGATRVLDGVSFEIGDGETVAVMGPSGCGKTTLLRCINGLEAIDSGSIEVLGHSVAPLTRSSFSGSDTQYESLDDLRSDVGMVFQHLYLWPHKTVRQNIVEAPVRIKKLSRDDADARSASLLDRVGLSAKANEYPHRLSGGEQQRAAIARALAMDPKILLLDEITSALDPELVSEVLDLVGELTHQGRTMVIVTHEIRFAREAADRVLFLADGVVLEDTSPEEFFSAPQTKRGQEFLGRASRYRR